MERQLTFDDARREEARQNPGWGGIREGAGRKAAEDAPVHHVRRANVPSGTPVHVTLRVRRGIPSLRNPRFLREWRRTLRKACDRQGFRVIHYSVQGNHAHLIAEAPGGKRALGCGMKAVGQRFAHCVNRVFDRKGPVLHGRYHLTLLTTPTQVRNALAYLLLNVRKHWREAGRRLSAPQIDPYSSGRWFDGWRGGSQATVPADEPPEVAPAGFWILDVGWRRRGLIALSEVPGGQR